MNPTAQTPEHLVGIAATPYQTVTGTSATSPSDLTPPAGSFSVATGSGSVPGATISEAEKLAASMDANASVELLLASIAYYQSVVRTHALLIEATASRLNKTLRRHWEDANVRQPTPNTKAQPDAQNH